MAAALLLLSTNHIISVVVSRICAMLVAVVLQESVGLGCKSTLNYFKLHT